jgi:hypothetical protein
MKHFSIALLLLALLISLAPFPSTHAQEDEATVAASASERYRLTVPESWISSDSSFMPDLLGLFPAETLTVASDEAALTTMLNAVQDDLGPSIDAMSGLQGAVISSGVMPGAMLNALGLSAEEFFSFGVVLQVQQVDSNFEESSFTLGDLQGTRYDYELADGTDAAALSLIDSQDNLLMLFGFSDAGNLADLDAVIESLDYTDFSQESLLKPENLTVAYPILPDKLEMDIAPGWWVMDTTTDAFVAPSLAGIESFLTPDAISFGGLESIFFMGTTSDRGEFPALALNEDGTVDREMLAALLELAAPMMGEADDSGVTLGETRAFDTESGLPAILLDISYAELDADVRMVMLDGEDELMLVMAMTAEGNLAKQAELVEAVFASLRLVEME